jgi:hypothetical protein
LMAKTRCLICFSLLIQQLPFAKPRPRVVHRFVPFVTS